MLRRASRPGEHRAVRCPRHAGIRVHQLGHAEVEQLRRSASGDQDVGRLEIAVEDSLAVRILERAGNLHRQAQRLVRGQGAADRMALYVLQHRIVGADIVHLTDVRMVERGDRARFLVEAVGVGSRELPSVPTTVKQE